MNGKLEMCHQKKLLISKKNMIEKYPRPYITCVCCALHLPKPRDQ